MKWYNNPKVRRSVDVLFWVLILGFIGYRIWPQVSAALAVGSTESDAPAFELVTLEGERVSLESLRGQVVLLNFWATWCPPCRVEMPGFERVYQEKRAQGFTVLGVSTDRTGTRGVRDFLTDRGVTFPVAMATRQVVRDYGGARALPTSFLIDRRGRIRHQVTGYFAEPALRMAVDRLLAEDPPPGSAGGVR